MPDIARDPAIRARRRLRHMGFVLVTILTLVGVSIALARMEPAPPSVDEAVVVRDTVKRGTLVRQVRGLGTLVPEDTRWIPAVTDGRVERIRLQPGAHVEADTVILELSNPQLAQEARSAVLALQSAEAGLENLRAQLDAELFTQQAQVAILEADLEQAQMKADANEALAREQLVSELTRRESQLQVETLRTRVTLERQRAAAARQSIDARLRVQQVAVDQARAITELFAIRLAALAVSAGFAGVLQQVPVEVGQRIGGGTNLARVADPTRLKAELKISETQAKDVEVGQPAAIDTRNGIIPGRVSRKDPAATNGTVTVDVTLEGALPRGAVPDMGIDGTIQLERLDDVLYVQRPALAQEDGAVGLFRVNRASGIAERVRVELGRGSVTSIEVKAGLAEGDEVVLSDMSGWDGFDRVRLR